MPAVVLVGPRTACSCVGAALVWRAHAKTNTDRARVRRRSRSRSSRPAAPRSARRARTSARSTLGRGERRAAVHLGLRRHRPRAPGRDRQARRGPATLDCRNASASSQAVAAEARAIDARQQALAARGGARRRRLLDGGFVSPNEAEQKSAQSAAEDAQLASQRAKLASTRLEVSDCVLRAPFDGEIATRTVDPGRVRAPRHADRLGRRPQHGPHDVRRPRERLRRRRAGHAGRRSTSARRTGRSPAPIARRSPSADPETRTVHFEIDLPDPTREIPVGHDRRGARSTSASRVPATEVPLVAALDRGTKATALRRRRRRGAHDDRSPSTGEQGGDLFVETALAPGARVVTEGRALLDDGDRVDARRRSRTRAEPPDGRRRRAAAERATP